jgi:hypothetical protein
VITGGSRRGRSGLGLSAVRYFTLACSNRGRRRPQQGDKKNEREKQSVCDFTVRARKSRCELHRDGAFAGTKTRRPKSHNHGDSNQPNMQVADRGSVGIKFSLLRTIAAIGQPVLRNTRSSELSIGHPAKIEDGTDRIDAPVLCSPTAV